MEKSEEKLRTHVKLNPSFKNLLHPSNEKSNHCINRPLDLDCLYEQATADQAKQSDSTQQNQEQEEIAATVHGFYTWYDKFQQDEKRNLNFLDESGACRKLDLKLLEQFYAYLKSSGFLSDELIDADRKLMKACEKTWIKEGKEGLPNCLDEDRFFCSQD